MTINYLDKIYDRKLVTREMTRKWLNRFDGIVRKFKEKK